METKTTIFEVSLISSLLLTTLSQYSKEKYDHPLLDDEAYLINTTGCYLPNYALQIDYKEKKNTIPAKDDCGQRIVTIKKVSDYVIKFDINQSALMEDEYNCCYNFATRSKETGFEDHLVEYTKCLPFQHNDEITLQDEVITIRCTSKVTEDNKLKYFYDKHLILKKKQIGSQSKEREAKKHWNVLVIGMDTMSRGRAYHSLPDTMRYLHENNWLDYRAYHKIGKTTFPNVMAMLTGKEPDWITKACIDSMEKCRHLIIWNRFRDAGYVTGFGEDAQRSMFHDFNSFRSPPTDHYARPMFETGEYKQGTTTCIERRPSDTRLLYYAAQFVDAYKNDKFFGFFWITNSGHDPDQIPQHSDSKLTTFFRYLERNDVLENTFVFFLSDHGFNYGPKRISPLSYYDSKLPMLFMWVPRNFVDMYPDSYMHLKLNQFSLTTHFDMYATFWTVLKESSTIRPNENCTHCVSLNESISPDRTCEDARISERWCACHGITEVTDKGEIGRTARAAFIDVSNMVFTAETVRCYKCSTLVFMNVSWVYKYERNDKKYYIVSFVVNPGQIRMEAKVENQMIKYRALYPTESISSYIARSFCAKTKKDYCVCQKKFECI